MAHLALDMVGRLLRVSMQGSQQCTDSQLQELQCQASLPACIVQPTNGVVVIGIDPVTHCSKEDAPEMAPTRSELHTGLHGAAYLSQQRSVCYTQWERPHSPKVNTSGSSSNRFCRVMVELMVKPMSATTPNLRG